MAAESDSGVNETKNDSKEKKNVKAKMKKKKKETEEADEPKYYDKIRSRTVRNVLWSVVIVFLCVDVGLIIWKAPSKFGASDANANTQEVAPTPIPTRPPPTKITCETPGCTKYAENMLAHMNQDQKACQDPHDLACGTYAHSTGIVTERMKKMLGEPSPIGLMVPAQKLFDLCEAGKATVSPSLAIARQTIPSTDKVTAEAYRTNLAKAGITNFGHYKLDLERLSDPNDVNPKSVLVIQNRADYGPNPNFGYEDPDTKVSTQFDQFDSIDNRMSPKDELVRIKDIESIDANKLDMLMVFLKGWFPESADNEFIKANVWTYKYAYWTTPLSIPQGDLDLQIKQFHYDFAFHAVKKSLNDAIYTPKDCYKMVVETIPQAFAQYTEKDEDKEKVKKVEGLAKKYKDKSVEVLKKAVMDDDSRQKLIDRVEHFKVVVGYPEDWKNSLDTKNIDPAESLMKNLNTAYPEVRKWQVLQHFKYLANPQDHYPAFYGFYASKTYYNTKENILHLHPSLLDDPFFDDTYPAFVNYGGFGQLIGKGVSDAIAQLYHEEGTAGASTKSKDAYKATSKCFADQGQKVANEAITDNIGTLVSYQLMDEEVKKSKEEGKEHVLKGFEKFNNAQWFFLVAAKRICVSPLEGLSTKTSAANDLKTIGKDRIKGLMANLPQYATTFNCQESTPMRLTTPCHLY